MITDLSCARVGAPMPRLARYSKRWFEGEQTLIYYGRVERFLRSSFTTGEWKQLGNSVPFNNVNLPQNCNVCLFSPAYWGFRGGVGLISLLYDPQEKRTKPAFVGEGNLISIFARDLRLNLAERTKSEREEMDRLKFLISPEELWLTNYYGQYFKIPRGFDRPYNGEKLAMQLVAAGIFHLNPGETPPKILFHGKGNSIEFQLACVHTGTRNLLLPITYYSSVQNPWCYCMMPEIPDQPVLYNSDAIATHPEAEVILSDEIGIPLVNDNEDDRIFSSWYGGIAAMEHFDWELLRGHRIVWLCYDNDSDPAEKFRKAVRAATIFEMQGIQSDFWLADHTTWTSSLFNMERGHYEQAQKLSRIRLLECASRYGICDNHSGKTLTLSMDDLMSIKERDFVLFPVLKEGFYCLIYGGSGVAKTWFSLHLAIAISQGTTPFDKWAFRGKPLNVLFVAGEMSEDVYGERLKSLLAGQATNSRFRLLRENLDLTMTEGQEKIASALRAHECRVVIFDNLSTLSSNGHTEGQFGKIHRFFKELQQQGLIVILVHHENREGTFKGTGKIELVADQSLHLFSTKRGDKIELLVQAEKIRMTARNVQSAFRTEFDPQNPVPVWPVFRLNAEERMRLNEDDPLDEVAQNLGKKRNNQCLAWSYLDDDERAIAIIDDMLSGCPDDVIAANFAVRERVISDFKQQNGISEETLKRHLPDAKKRVQREQEKSKPSLLAPFLWESLKKESQR